MKILFLVVLFFVSIENTKEVVKEYHQLKSEESELKFIETYKESTDPSILAYVVSISMKQAEYSYNPFYKLSVFKENKLKLEELIKTNNSNVHLRYIRLLIQEKIPSFLGYNDSIEEDKLFLKKKLEVKDESDYLDVYIKGNTSL